MDTEGHEGEKKDLDFNAGASPATSMTKGDHSRPVAVVAVHGVGYCAPYSISRHVASLLLGLGRLRLREGVDWPIGGQHVAQPYQSCVEEFIRILLKRVLVSNAGAAQARLVPEPPAA
jgi:hypothetical protein